MSLGPQPHHPPAERRPVPETDSGPHRGRLHLPCSTASREATQHPDFGPQTSVRAQPLQLHTLLFLGDSHECSLCLFLQRSGTLEGGRADRRTEGFRTTAQLLSREEQPIQGIRPVAVSGGSQPGGLRLGVGPPLTVVWGAALSPGALCRQRGVRASLTALEPLVPDLSLATFVSNDLVPQRASRIPLGSWEVSIPIKPEKD